MNENIFRATVCGPPPSTPEMEVRVVINDLNGAPEILCPAGPRDVGGAMRTTCFGDNAGSSNVLDDETMERDPAHRACHPASPKGLRPAVDDTSMVTFWGMRPHFEVVSQRPLADDDVCYGDGKAAFPLVATRRSGHPEDDREVLLTVEEDVQ